LWVRSATKLYELGQGQPRFVDRSAGIPHAASSYLNADQHGRLYVSSDSGVVVLDGANRTLIDSQHGLPADAVGPVLLDREESLWLGTFGGGLTRRLGHGEWLSWKKEDGLVDVLKVKPLIFTPDTHEYYGVGRFIGRAFSMGENL